MGSKANISREVAKYSNNSEAPKRRGIFNKIGRKAVALFGDRGAGFMASASAVKEKILTDDPTFARRRALALGAVSVASLVIGFGAVHKDGQPTNQPTPKPLTAGKSPDTDTVPMLLSDPEGPWGLSREVLIANGNEEPTTFQVNHFNMRLVQRNGIPTEAGADRNLPEMWVDVPAPVAIEVQPQVSPNA